MKRAMENDMETRGIYGWHYLGSLIYDTSKGYKVNRAVQDFHHSQ